ncbi:MAG: hypothetical protein WCZ09_00340 [Bacilli bacterium]
MLEEEIELIKEKNYQIKIKVKKIITDLKKRKKLKYINQLIKRYNKSFTHNERMIIYYSFMNLNKQYNYDIALKCGYSETYFYRKKKELIFKLAHLLNLEEYVEGKGIIDIMRGVDNDETNC